MKVSYVDAAATLGVAPLQVLVEFAAMNQPWEECWPDCEEGFVETLRQRRRVRMGFVEPRAKSSSMPASRAPERLSVSVGAAAILNKLVSKSYGLKRIRVSTLLLKWVHGSTEDDVRELIQRGNLEWSDGARSTVNLVAAKLLDTEHIADIYRNLQSSS